MMNGLALRANVTTNSSGAATVYLSRGGQADYPLPVIAGPWSLEAISYIKNDFATGVDFTITEAETGLSLWTESDVNASTTHEDPTLLIDSQIKIVIANGGANKTGQFVFKLVEGRPSTVGSGITGLSGDVTASGVGTVSAVVNSVNVTASPAADATATGIIVALTYGESLAPGDPVYIKSDGAVWKADANSAGKFPADGIALETASSGTHNVLLNGIMRLDSWSWTVGGIIYLSTSGGLTQTAPSSTDDCVQVIGKATHADRMRVNPSPDYITVV